MRLRSVKRLLLGAHCRGDRIVNQYAFEKHDANLIDFRVRAIC